MRNRNQAINEKIKELYPEICEQHLSTSVGFDLEKNSYIVTARRGTHIMSTYLETQSAEECLDGRKCVSLGVQVEQFIKNFEEREVFERSAA